MASVMSIMRCWASPTSRSSLKTETTLLWGGRVCYTESRDAVLPAQCAPSYHSWQLVSGEDWITFHRDGDSYVLRFPDLADFRISAHGRQVHCDTTSDMPDATLRHLLNQIMPLVLNGQRA